MKVWIVFNLCSDPYIQLKGDVIRVYDSYEKALETAKKIINKQKFPDNRNIDPKRLISKGMVVY